DHVGVVRAQGRGGEAVKGGLAPRAFGQRDHALTYARADVRTAHDFPQFVKYAYGVAVCDVSRRCVRGVNGQTQRGVVKLTEGAGNHLVIARADERQRETVFLHRLVVERGFTQPRGREVNLAVHGARGNGPHLDRGGPGEIIILDLPGGESGEVGRAAV